MGWLKRLFGLEKPQNAEVNPTPQLVPQASNVTFAPETALPSTATQAIPPERLGLNGEYDQSGLAKRVALAFDQDQLIDDVDTLWVAQSSSNVVLKGKVPSQEILNRMVSVASSVNGATGVETNQVTIG